MNARQVHGHDVIGGRTPAAASACRAIASPSSVITAADVIGSHRVTRGPSSWNRDISLRAYTMRMPIVTSTAASPTLKATRSEEHTSELQSRLHLVCRLLLEKKKKT